MNANYLYDIFETTEKNEAPDLTIGLAMLRSVQEIPDGMTDRGIREFLGRHYTMLVEAYQTHDREKFANTVAVCEAMDVKKAEQV